METNKYMERLSVICKWSPETNRKYIYDGRNSYEGYFGKEFKKPTTSVRTDAEEFINAASMGNLKMLLMLLSKVQTNVRNANGQTALIASVINDQILAVKFLLAKQASVDLLDETGNGAIHYACLNDNVDILKMLLEKADPNLKNFDGETIIFLAVKNEKSKVFHYLVGQNKINFNERDGDGNTVIHIAIQGGNVKFLQKLLDLEIDLTLYNKDGMNPVNVAIALDNIECLKCLIDSKYGPNVLQLNNMFNEYNFQLAVRKRSTCIVNYLLGLNIGPSITTEIDSKYGFSCLHWAVLQLNSDLVVKILTMNEKLINVKDARGFTVLEHLVNIYDEIQFAEKNILDTAVELLCFDADIYLVTNRIGLRKLIKDIAMRHKS